MARSDRLFRLLQAMRMMSPPITAARLAEETGVSMRSLYRDIDSLRAAGARIEGERGYGYRLLEDNALPPQMFERTEIEAIVLGLAEVRHMGDPTLAQAAKAALAKVAATLPDEREQQMVHAISRVYRPEARYPEFEQIEALREACWREVAIEIGYVDKAGVRTKRTVLPLAVVYTERVLTLLAWCRLREGFRMFRLDGIRGLATTRESFRPRRASLLRTYLGELEGKGVP